MENTQNTAKMANPWNEYTKAYRKRHPEKAEQWRINSAIKLLRKKGYNVEAPIEETAEAGER
jgi:hypothetical protein